MEMTLAKALKEKARLAGKMKEFMDVRCNNVYLAKDEPKINVKDVWYRNQKNMQKMIALKSAIAKANAEHGVCERIYEMEELKSVLTWLNCINTDTTPIRKVNPVTGIEDVTERKAFVSFEEQQEELVKIQDRINQLQDEIDEINATATINVRDF